MGRRYDNDFRRAAVLYWLRGEKPQPEVARELGIPFETLRRWCIDREALLDGTPGDFDHRAVLGLDAVPVVSEVDARQLPMFPALVVAPAPSEPPSAKVIPLDDPPPSVVDRLAEQQMAMYSNHPDVIAQAKAFAAQALAEAQTAEAEARAAMAKEMLAKVQSERRAMDVRAALDGRDELLARHTQLLRLAQKLLLGSEGNDPNVVNRVQAVIHLASELRLATRES
jgi:hypothetical protein